MLGRTGSAPIGLSGAEAQQRLGRAKLQAPRKGDGRVRGDVGLLLNQFKSPIVLILVFAAVLSAFLHDPADSVIIVAIVIVSAGLGFWQERGAAGAVAQLLALVRVRATVLRDGTPREVPVEEVVTGDVVTLSAGDSVPGDCLLLEAVDLTVDESALTGETFPVGKAPGVLDPDTPPGRRKNSLFLGTHAVSGTASALVVATGAETEFGKVSERLRLRPPETDFERGIRRLGYLLMEVTSVLVLAIFAANVYFHRPVLESLLFSLALAVGLTPQLLPAIITVNLSHGAKRMAASRVIVKRLASIENFGAMNVLCSDKTGTLTEGVVHLRSSLDVDGVESVRVLAAAHLNASLETGFKNPIDEAIRTQAPPDISSYRKLGEIPYDFIRKRLSVLADRDGSRLMVTKGALSGVLSVCSLAETPGGAVPLADRKKEIDDRFLELSLQGFRTLGVAVREEGLGDTLAREDEAGMTFVGFLVLSDPPKASAAQAVRDLAGLGISLKVITGDSAPVAATVIRELGLPEPSLLTGPEIRHMSDEALRSRAGSVELFAEVEPNQKERIVLALKKAGNVVGYIGDGINDASALHAADVGLSVAGAVDVAKEAADIVLLERDLGVLVDGVREGRVTFTNTLKYILMATSANFGNMFSMAGVSLFLPFLPLLPKQILLTNLLTDVPEMTIASDNVDPEVADRPRKWDIAFLRRFMVVFGLVSSLFDYATFGLLLWVLGANQNQFRTGWFLESVVSASLVVLVVRTRRPFFQSRPGRALALATAAVAAATLALPLTPLADLFELVRLPATFFAALLGIVVLYGLSAEAAKHVFYRFHPVGRE
ncbi:MAG: magnesium-translocating P-type ATPase [Deltaproteobacteria bacterium]|nr:magnesium-translocating P-type ATPase [Deltaproteobacteria bacterium]